MEICSGNKSKLAHTTINMDAKYFEIETTIRLATTARRATTTMKIRLNSAAHPRTQFLHLRTDLHNLDPQLVTQDTRIREKGLLSAKRVKIRTTYPDLPNTNQSLIG